MLRPRVCDACHSRKVRCDRNETCGNCLDQNTACTRSRGMRRLPKRDRSSTHLYRRARTHQNDGSLAIQRTSSSGAPEDALFNSPHHQINDRFLVDLLDHERLMLVENLDMRYELNSWISIVPLTDAQMINRHRVEVSESLVWSGRQALESALSIASRVLGNLEQHTEDDEDPALEGQRHIPSVEFLYWMLASMYQSFFSCEEQTRAYQAVATDISSDQFGLFISDFFRHISKETLKRMGFALLGNSAPTTDSTLYTVCVNSVAYKFINATLSSERDDELAQSLRYSALLYRETAKAALKKVPLMTKPSLTLLQALLCGIFLHQGSGDTNACRELVRTACRVAMDIGLSPDATSLQNTTEEEYYCFMWCYILDRNYVWKFGGPPTLNTKPETIRRPLTRSIIASKLILVYLDLAHIQEAMIPFLNDPSKATRDNAFNCVDGEGTNLLRKMESIQGDIEQIRLPSVSWKGLDFNSEMATLDFSYYSIMTHLLHLRHVALGETAVDNYLNSARHELRALIALCAPGGDQQKTVAYLHWTLLYYPITAYFALFCNTIATSHAGDFHILNFVSNILAQSGQLSPPIAAMQVLLQELVSLSRRFFAGADDDDDDVTFTRNANTNTEVNIPTSVEGMLPFHLEPASVETGCVSGFCGWAAD